LTAFGFPSSKALKNCQFAIRSKALIQAGAARLHGIFTIAESFVLQPFSQSERLDQVRYDIRGPLNARALELEAQGHKIIKLNIGNPALFGFTTPAHLQAAVVNNIGNSEAYVHQQGITPAREAIARSLLARGMHVSPQNIYVGNGVSELIDLTLRALLNNGDEVLLPAPDYPLWTAAVHLNAGVPRYYDCLAANNGLPDPEQVERLITKKTRALVLINPNNPTGAVYPKALVQQLARIAERHGLVLMSDEIYESLLFDDAQFHSAAPMVHDTLAITFSGLSKVHRACGYRVGWFSLSGALKPAREYIKALDVLAALRLCSNVAGQWAVPAALDGPDTCTALCQPGGRLYESRKALMDGIARSRYLQCAKPMGAIYAFPGVDTHVIPDFDDQQFAMTMLEREHTLIVPGSSFNVRYRNHLRMTLLPEAATIRKVISAMDAVLAEMAGQTLAMQDSAEMLQATA
jgi:alanine-synthesizing transaminase